MVPPRQTWQMARASASEASAGRGASSSRRIRVTMAPTCSFEARPEPVIAALTSLGVCRVTAMPRRAATSIATPAACAVPITVCTLCWANTRSTASAVGRCSVIQASTVSSITSNRREMSRSGAVRTTSTAISCGCRPGRPSTTPSPHRVRPGSIPSTRMRSPRSCMTRSRTRSPFIVCYTNIRSQNSMQRVPRERLDTPVSRCRPVLRRRRRSSRTRSGRRRSPPARR